MRTRPVDVLLMVGLFIVAGAILWTLFTLGNDRGRPERPAVDQPPAAEEAASESDANDATGGGDVVAVVPGAASEPDAPDGAATEPSESDAPPSSADEADAADASPPASATSTPGDDPEDFEELVEGEPVTLQRVGFSFVTGGAGACGIVLEPWTHVAVSRELLATYGCGTEVTVSLDDEVGGRTEATLIVADTMNPSFSRTANIYVGEDEPALAYGITSGTLVP